MSLSTSITAFSCLITNIALLPFRLIWNTVVVIGAVALTVVWLLFVFGSVVGVILLLIFAPEGFLLPMALLAFMTPLWADCD